MRHPRPLHDGQPVPARPCAGLVGGLSTDIVEATTSYETWLRSHCEVVEEDLEAKHRAMAADQFVFLRGTAYRWAQRWPTVCHHLTGAPSVLAVADLHVENFGTWRDIEGRLVWGVNDVDEAATLPYTSDLVRLVTSTTVAKLELGGTATAAAVLDGYRAHLAASSQPFVLAEDHPVLRDLAVRSLKDPAPYWTKLTTRVAGDERGLRPDGIAAATAALPAGTTDAFSVHRVAGVGSLGRPRIVTIGKLHRAHVAREAKAIVPSAWAWANDVRTVDQSNVMSDLVGRAVRAPDPFWSATDGWIVRRLAPDCSRIELADLPKQRDELRLLRAMGAEAANMHLATPGMTPSLLADLDRRGDKWLAEAAQAMAADVAADHSVWAHHVHGPDTPAPKR